jgi:tetratricopeptide (TPR) repeat protein
MRIGESMNDGLFVGQMNFIIGRVYNLKQEYENSVCYHEKHLNLAQQFQDSKGQCRAYFILSQLYDKINQYDKAKKYLSLYKTLARDV